MKMASRRFLSAATAVECVTVFAGRRPDQDQMIAFNLLIEELENREIALLEAEHWRAAAEGLLRFGKGRHPARLNLGDSFAYALAKVAGEPLLFKGDDFARTDIQSVS